jgi:hypothetical protein
LNDSSGKTYLGTQTITTDESGDATISYYGPLLPAGSDYVTATATDPGLNTSEFSNGVTSLV